MGITDKILLVLLVVLLPLGVLVSRQIFEPSEEEVLDERAQQLVKIEKLLDEIAKNESTPDAPTRTDTSSINIDTVSFASDSGIFKMTGTKANSSVMVKITTIEHKRESNSVQNQAVSNVKALGKPVVIEAIEPLSDGSFLYEYLPNISSGIIEVTVEQNGNSSTVGYDVVMKREAYRSSSGDM